MVAEVVFESPVMTNLKDLEDSSIPFTALEAAFGPSSLGILIVKDLPPRFIDLRQRLLSYASYLANLSPEVLESLSCPTAKYLVGWSHGKESLKNGHYDTLKGSYYINCAFHVSPHLSAAPLSLDFPNFPEYTAPNIWPPEDLLPGFRETAEELCGLVIDTAALVARACDRYAGVYVEGYEKGYLERVVKGSLTTKARLLHYFPLEETSISGNTPSPSSPSSSSDGNDNDDDSWCATHVDHGCLTGLTSALYIGESAHPPTLPSNSSLPSLKQSIPPLPSLPSSPDPLAGLYIRSRTGITTKINIPSNCLAFQTGEALEVITRGKFRAVPHFVKTPRAGGEEGRAGMKVARNTLAVFTQPNLEEVVDLERGVKFGDFAREVVGRHG